MNSQATYNKRRKKAESARGFSRRISERKLRRWTNPFRPNQWRYYLKQYDLLNVRLTRFQRDEPVQRWLGCDSWQRLLINKWNSRIFVQRHGIPVPELYWHGRYLNNLPWQNLPDRYVIRPTWGTNRRGVHVVADGKTLLGKGPVDSKGIRQALISERGIFNVVPLLLEEAILPQDGPARLPTEYKCHMFGSKVGAIQIIDRGASGAEFRTRYYNEQWVPFKESLMLNCESLPVQEPPAFLGPMLEWATKLGKEIATYMRIDFLGFGKRCVFNEFSSAPGTRYNSPFFDEVFEELWQTHIPGQV